MKKIICILMCFAFCCLCGCNADTESSKTAAIKSIAYNGVKSENFDDCIVYINENGSYVPFIVVDKGYNGKTLLLRKEVLSQPQRMNEYSSYYEGGEIDVFLNGEYLNRFNEQVKMKIVNIPLEIAADESLGLCAQESTVIIRKVFLLSLTEINGDDSINAAYEGSPLRFFKNQDNRIAQRNGKNTSWWLRSPDTYYLSCTYAVGPDGTIGFGNASDTNGIRPAFCVDGFEQISQRNNIVDGKTCWVLE